MNSNQNLTYNRQSASLNPTCYHNLTSSLTPAPTPLSRSQPSGDSDLFATLLFDRQRAYQRSSSTFLAPHSSSPSTIRDFNPATQSLQLKHGAQVAVMPSKTRNMSEKEKRQVEGKRVTKTPSAKPDRKLVRRRVARSPEVTRETASREDKDVVMTSSGEEEAQEIQHLRDELEIANARIKLLEELLENKQTASRNPSIEHDDRKDVSFKAENNARKHQPYDLPRTEESAPLQVTNSQKKPIALTVQIQPQLPLTPQSPLSSVPPASPYPGTISAILNEEDIKLENVRATYTKVKTKLDTIKLIVRKLDWCTESMDVSNFGEFGVHMKRLREWLEEDEQKQLQQQHQKQSKE
ncbi:hypothetical protein yc1106_00586 [Curvularia clavata]|uniref:Uncharacterized protein n=1 Tax=Curvularia clavata TaxID=95742 RepID=A0A9Q9DNF2_CURCL|nr:hypothetical protein yc1106_00586 [Curvularia clavata]